jgi:hypothetical protein
MALDEDTRAGFALIIHETALKRHPRTRNDDYVLPPIEFETVKGLAGGQYGDHR